MVNHATCPETFLPTMFVSHGAPTFALSPGEAGAALTDFASQLPRPKAVMVISAHWDTEYPCLSVTPRPDTVHDFYGFPKPLYDIRYPAPGAVAWAMEARALLEEDGFQVSLSPQRGLDHGVWVPLLHMFPEASVPVATLSIQGRQDAAYHYRLGQTLAPLREAGVLLLGSGGLTHNLQDCFSPQDVNECPGYARQFQDWMHRKLQQRDVSSLLAYREQAPGAVAAHPTDEHLLPLYVALGAAGKGCACEIIHSGIEHRVLAMDSFAFRPMASTEAYRYHGSRS